MTDNNFGHMGNQTHDLGTNSLAHRSRMLIQYYIKFLSQKNIYIFLFLYQYLFPIYYCNHTQTYMLVFGIYHRKLLYMEAFVIMFCVFVMHILNFEMYYIAISIMLTDQDKFVYLMEFQWKEVSVYLEKAW